MHTVLTVATSYRPGADRFGATLQPRAGNLCLWQIGCTEGSLEKRSCRVPKFRDMWVDVPGK